MDSNTTPHVTRIVKKSEGRVPIRPPSEEDREHCVATVQRSMSIIKERKLAGTRKLRFGDLLDPNTDLVVTARAKRVSPVGSDIPNVVEWLKTIALPSSTNKSLLLAGPGEGKTTISLLLLCELATAYLKSGGTASFPLLIDLRTERTSINATDYGTLEWLRSFTEAHYGASAGRLCADSQSGSRPLCVILDSLDEVLAGRSFADVRSILERHVFTEAAVVLCRSHFYEQYLQYLPFVTNRDIVALRSWHDSDILRYITAFYMRLTPEGRSSGADAFIEWMHTSPSLPAILQVPIRLNMALDMYSPTADLFPRHRTLLQLYEAYMSWSINLERSRTTDRLEDTYTLLEDIAWDTYGERESAAGTTSGTTERSLRTFLTNRNPHASKDQIETKLSYLLNLGLLAMSDDVIPSRDHSIEFVHKSFQECLVATRVAGAITSSAQESARMCAYYLTPAVSEFLKEAIDRLNTHPREIIKATNILIDAITRTGVANPIQDVAAARTGRNRLMVEQLCYYLGNLESRTAQNFLLQRIDGETDEWIRRGIAVGLAFGGQDKPLQAYLAELRLERASGGKTPKSDANIGFHLSFFGDQPFDSDCPDKDMGFEECGKTVGRLIYQLGTDTNRPNWRIDLYTLLDLRHRSISEISYWAQMRAHVVTLRRLHEHYAREDETKRWPETKELGVLLGDERLAEKDHSRISDGPGGE